MKKNTKFLNKAITVTNIYEAYFDLWGYSLRWIHTIQDTILDYKEIETSDLLEEAEAYECEACVAARFSSTDKSRVEKLCAKVNSLLALAQKTHVSECQYERMVG